MIQLPEEIKVLLTFLITQGFKALANLLKVDFEGWVSAAVAVVVGALLFFIEGLLALIPEEYRELAEGILGLLVLVLSAFGSHYTYRNVASYARS